MEGSEFVQALRDMKREQYQTQEAYDQARDDMLLVYADWLQDQDNVSMEQQTQNEALAELLRCSVTVRRRKQELKAILPDDFLRVCNIQPERPNWQRMDSFKGWYSRDYPQNLNFSIEALPLPIVHSDFAMHASTLEAMHRDRERTEALRRFNAMHGSTYAGDLGGWTLTAEQIAEVSRQIQERMDADERERRAQQFTAAYEGISIPPEFEEYYHAAPFTFRPDPQPHNQWRTHFQNHWAHSTSGAAARASESTSSERTLRIEAPQATADSGDSSTDSP
jgi:hypothetical protein